MSREEKRNMVWGYEGNTNVSLRKKCELLELNRSSLYYRPKTESQLNIEIMRLLDEEYTRHPFYGVEKMVRYLRELGYVINPKRVRRLLRLMGLMAVCPKKKWKGVEKQNKIYPYLLGELKVTHPNHVFCTDITYIRLKQGFVYLVAIMDWYSRFVLSWKLSNSLDTSFCIEALEDALVLHGCPEIFNTDQGVQFTSEAFTKVLLVNNIKISMDAKGRAFDNIFIERLWRTVKYEEVYLHDYASIKEAQKQLEKYFIFYNNERRHQGLNYRTPKEVYFGEKPIDLWTSPSDQPEPFGMCGKPDGQLQGELPTGFPHSLASCPQDQQAQ